MRKLIGCSLIFLITLGLFAQEEIDLTRRERLIQAQEGLLENRIFTAEEIMSLENARQQAILNGETENAEDLAIILFALRKSGESLSFGFKADEVLKASWEKESRRRELELTRGLMNGTAGTLAVLAAGALTAGYVYFQLSGEAFANYSGSVVNSPEAYAYRRDYQIYERTSFGLMIGSAVLFTLSTRLMFLQN